MLHALCFDLLTGLCESLGYQSARKQEPYFSAGLSGMCELIITRLTTYEQIMIGYYHTASVRIVSSFFSSQNMPTNTSNYEDHKQCYS